MIELDEKDIKAVGRSRFIRVHEKQLSIMLLSCTGIFLGLAYLVGKCEACFRFPALIPVAVLFIYIIWYIRNLGKAEKKFLETWKKENSMDEVREHFD